MTRTHTTAIEADPTSATLESERRENTSTGVRGRGEAGKSIMKGVPFTLVLEGWALGVAHSVGKAPG